MGIDWEGMAEGYDGSVQDWYEDQIEKANKYEEMYRDDDYYNRYDEVEEEEENETEEEVNDEVKEEVKHGYGVMDLSAFEEVIDESELPF